MAERPRNILICSCEDTMPLDGEAVARVCRGAKVVEGRQLCRAELERFRKLAAGGAPLTVACTQESPLFEEVAGEIKGAAPTELRQYSRDRRLVEGRQGSRPENGGADRGQPPSRRRTSPSFR